jgi:hypothetical protein
LEAKIKKKLRKVLKARLMLFLVLDVLQPVRSNCCCNYYSSDNKVFKMFSKLENSVVTLNTVIKLEILRLFAKQAGSFACF